LPKESIITFTFKNAGTQTFVINEQQNYYTIGRNPDCGIYVNDASVSGVHGRFFLQNDKLFYADLNSTNGSFVNGRQITKAVELHDGSVIFVAGIHSAIKLTVALPEESQTISVEASVSIPALPNNPNNLNDLSGKETILIGRDPSCDITLNNQNVSRFHAKLLRRNGRFYVEDNNSTNGTFINGTRIDRVCEITVKDDVYVASVRLRLKNGVLTQDDAEEKGLSVQVCDLFRKVPAGDGKTKILLDHISLSIEPNEFVAIIGGSGAGKSTFTNVLCGKTAPSAYKGHVGFNDSSAASRGIFKSVIGYAPQNDVLYHDLTLHQMLFYSAKLKMPQDTKTAEYEERVKYVIKRVALTGHENTLVRRLSGGQQKRASIAVELLSAPKLFFLDEPTSGLDPATERTLMRMLKNMTQDNKTIIAVTHVTQNLNLCDKVIVLGKGGKLCFFGTPQNTCNYFGVTDIVDIYDKINENPAEWQQKYQELKRAQGHQAEENAGVQAHRDSGYDTKKAKKDMKLGYNSGWSQFLVLSARYLRLTFGDPKRMLLLLLQAPLLGVLLMLVSNSSSDNAVFEYSTSAKSMLFSLTCAAFWVGMLNSIQEICKEKDIFAREKMSTVRLFPYIASKISVIGILCVFQAFVLVLIVQIFSGLPENTLGIQPFLGYFITACLTTVCAACWGLAVSSLSPNPDRAMAIAPIILLPQILFSGVVFELTGLMNLISNFIPCKLSMQNFGTLTNFNALPTSQDLAEKSINAMYSVTNSNNIYGTWQGLLISSVVCIAIFTVALKLKSKE